MHCGQGILYTFLFFNIARDKLLSFSKNLFLYININPPLRGLTENT